GGAALQAAFARMAAGDHGGIKGIGGCLLACDAGNPAAVATVRARKHRRARPLAVMLPTARGLPAAAAALVGSP
ncbi:Sua5/YciO/YrdC/YwlC family protein, partial [Klebsiella pneumoniae]|uniref:Sua5/YciO/YrdC/YwlC family protein n=1 Tax=Klebsiella pneumoniae TaxID=573 RepID=UPI0022484E8E